MTVGDPTVLSAPCFFLSRGSILPQVMGEDLTSPTRGTGDPKVPGRWSPLLYPPPPSTTAPLPSMPAGDPTVLSPSLIFPSSPPAPSVSFSLRNSFFPREHPPPDDGGGLDVADQGNRDPEGTRQVVPPSLPPPPGAAPPSTNSHMAGRMAFTTLSTCTTALGGVCPALHPRGCGVCEVHLARLPQSGNLWAHKALFGQGKISPKPKAPLSTWEGGASLASSKRKRNSVILHRTAAVGGGRIRQGSPLQCGEPDKSLTP